MAEFALELPLKSSMKDLFSMFISQGSQDVSFEKQHQKCRKI